MEPQPRIIMKYICDKGLTELELTDFTKVLRNIFLILMALLFPPCYIVCILIM